MSSFLPLLKNLFFTLQQATLSTAFSIGGGMLLARILFIINRPAYEYLLSLALLFPSLSIVIGYSTIIDRAFYGLPGIVACHVFLNLPLATLGLLKSYQQIPASVWHLAACMRLTRIRCFWWIELPLLKQSLIKLAALIFLFCISSFSIPLMIGGMPEYNTLTVLLYYNLIIQGNMTMSVYLLALKIGISMMLAYVIGREGDKPLTASFSEICLLPTCLQTHPWLYGVFIFLIALFFMPPLGALFVHLQHYPILLEKWVLIFSAVKISLSLGFISSFIAVTVAISMLLFLRRYWCFIEYLGCILMVVPTFALGALLFLFSFQYLQKPFSAFEALVGVNILAGLPVAVKILKPAIVSIEKNFGMLQRQLRLKGWAKIRWVYGPLLRPSLRLAFGLIFAYSLGDLGGVLLFNQSEIFTLPSLIYEAHGRFNLPEAGILSIVMLFIIMLFFMVLNIRIERNVKA